MVGHETVAEDSRAVLRGVPGQQIPIEPAVIIGVEYLLAVVAALRDVMRNTRNDDTRTPWHKSGVAADGRVLMENASVRFLSPLFVLSIEMPASLRSDGVRVHPGMPSDSLRNMRSSSPESPICRQVTSPGGIFLPGLPCRSTESVTQRVLHYKPKLRLSDR